MMKTIEVKIPCKYKHNFNILEQIYSDIIPISMTENLIRDVNITAYIKSNSKIDFDYGGKYDIEINDNDINYVKKSVYNDEFDKSMLNSIYKNEFAKTGFYDNFYLTWHSQIPYTDKIISEIDELLEFNDVLVTNLPIFKYNDVTYSIHQNLRKDEIIEVINNNMIVVIFTVEDPMNYHLKIPTYRCRVINKEIIKE